MRQDAVKLTPEQMLDHIPGPKAERFHIDLLRGDLLRGSLLRGQLQIELYVPVGEDLQKPHSRDECYVVIEGAGQFKMRDEMTEFKAGDFLFVPAGMEHRFLNFGDQLKTWVIFYGEEGGDQFEQ